MEKKASAPSARVVTMTAGLSARTASVPGASTTVTATKARTPGSVPAPLPASMTNRTRLPGANFRRPDRDGFRKPGFRQDADKPFRKNTFRRDGKPAFGARRRDRGFDGPALNDDEE